MKQFIFGFLLLFFNTSILFSQELNSNAKMIKEKYGYEYENNFKAIALKEWKDDYSMVLYEINQQSNSFILLMNQLKTENLDIFFNSIKEWSRDGYKEFNIKKITSEFKTISISNCVQLKVDWSMVKYEYEKQVKSKESF